MIRFSGIIFAKTRRLCPRIALSSSLQCLAVGLLASFTSTACAQQQTDVTIKQLLATTTTSGGQKIVLPQKDAELVASIFEIPRGAHLPEHEHPYPRYGYILSGSLGGIAARRGGTAEYQASRHLQPIRAKRRLGTSMAKQLFPEPGTPFSLSFGGWGI
jgi:hypothetical protein